MNQHIHTHKHLLDVSLVWSVQKTHLPSFTVLVLMAM